jgi:hypothetical protein
MAFYFPEGSRLQYSVTFGSAVTATAITNANPAVFTTSAAHGFVDDNFVLYEGGWEELNECVFKVDQLTATTFSALELDATDTTIYPAGTGAGTVRLVSNWVDVPQVANITRQGGTPITSDVPLIARRSPVRVTVASEPSNFNFELNWDPTLAVYKTMLQLSRRRANVALRILAGGSAPIVGYGTLFLDNVPSFAPRESMKVTGSLSMNNTPFAYQS